MLTSKGSTDARQYAAAFVTQCELPLMTGKEVGHECFSMVLL